MSMDLVCWCMFKPLNSLKSQTRRWPAASGDAAPPSKAYRKKSSYTHGSFLVTTVMQSFHYPKKT